jgi:hypothetical protein
MNAYVIVATKGRAKETYTLLDFLGGQTRPPEAVIVMGAEPSDIAGLETHPLILSGVAAVQLSPTAGCTNQRNAALAILRRMHLEKGGRQSFVVYFDDDYRPAPDWLERCEAHFSSDPNLAGVTGRVLADGVCGAAISEADALRYISAALPPLPHWSDMQSGQDVDSVYGCNMAFIDDVALTCSFDGDLPLYGWQEDCDYSGQARKFGRTAIFPDMRGVHLAVKGGRTSGLKLGYSQIANPLHIASRGNMRRLRAARFVAKAIAANTVRSFREHPLFDYRGRLRGNVMALRDILLGRCHPMQVMNLS